MKHIAIVCLATAAAAGAQAQTFNDTARVRQVEPQYETVSVPRQQCHTQWVTEQQPVAAPGRNYGGLVLGGVVGGLAGNQIGKGHGREAATAVGAVVGALAGEHLAGQNGWGAQPQYQPVQRQVQNCQTVNDVQNRLTGYRVTYEYRGQNYTTVVRDNPGKTIPVQVSVTPLQPEYHGAYRQY
jgi:uncharacterized protein YcfJ